MINDPELEALRERLEKAGGRSAAASNSGSRSKPDPDLLPALTELAYFYHASGRYQEAEELYRQALNIVEQSERGAVSQQALEIMHATGFLLRLKERFSDAEPFYRGALEISQMLYGPDDPQTARRRNYLAGLYFAWGKFDLAEIEVEASLAAYRKIAGEDSEVVGIASMALTLITSRQGKSDASRAHLKRATSLMPGTPHQCKFSTTGDLAAGLLVLSREKFKQGKQEEAEMLFRYSLLSETESLWPAHPLVAENVQLLADLYRSQYLPAEAEFLYLKALDIRRRVLGPDHLDVAVSAHSLGSLLHESGRYREAMGYLKEAVSIREKAGFPPLLANALRSLAATHRALREVDEAQFLEDRAEKIFNDYNPLA
ncbi:MAG: tetratricopeptide repeat protein [Candidatus Obscuribacterales bacterium]